MILAPHHRRMVLAAILGVAVGAGLPAVPAMYAAVSSLWRPWMAVSTIEVRWNGDRPEVLAHRVIDRLVVGGRYGVEVFEESEERLPHYQICGGTGVSTYSPTEPEIVGPMSLERWVGGQSGEPMRCLPNMAPGKSYSVQTVWCLPGNGECAGKIVGPRASFRVPDSWGPPKSGETIQ